MPAESCFADKWIDAVTDEPTWSVPEAVEFSVFNTTAPILFSLNTWKDWFADICSVNDICGDRLYYWDLVDYDEPINTTIPFVTVTNANTTGATELSLTLYTEDLL